MLLLAIPAGGLVVRLFIIQHDCGHGSFFGSRTANDACGRFVSLFTMTPYSLGSASTRTIMLVPETSNAAALATSIR
jgi:hypothetical protein